MLNELKKFAKNSPIYVTVDEKLSLPFAYAYVGNTIAYYQLDGNIDVYNDLIIPSDKEYSNIEDAIHSDYVSHDETPFEFAFDKESMPTSISANNFTKAVSQFTKFYDVEDYRTELTGLHVRRGTLFASDSRIMRLKKSNTFPSNTDMIIDVNPLVDYLGVNVRKVKSVGMSLFNSNKIKNDMLDISVINKNGDDALRVKHKNLTFIIISTGKSKVSFDFIGTMKPTHTIVVHRESLIKNLTKLINNPSTDSDAIKDYVRFRLHDKLEMSNYIYHKDGEDISKMNYKCLESSKEIKFVLDASNLLVLLKTVKDSNIQLRYDSHGNIARIFSDSSSDLLLIAQTTYK